jgi:hypothetical protein
VKDETIAEGLPSVCGDRCEFEDESLKHKAYQRFEMSQPNELWQMDFMGYLTLSSGERCYPLTVTD